MKTGRWIASGEPYVVVLDARGQEPLSQKRLSALSMHGGEQPARAVIRAVRSEHIPEGAAALQEDLEATWWCDARLPTGEHIGTSGNAARVLVDALLSWDALEFRDRRDAIPIGTPDGVRDVLAGRGGYAVDLGRWRMIHNAHDTAYTVQIGSENVAVSLGAETHSDTPNVREGEPWQAAVTWAQVSDHKPRIEKGVAHAKIHVFDSEGNERQSSSLAAAATALVLRHLGTRDTPHHWAIEMPGGNLAVRMFATEEGEHVSVSGAVNGVQPE